MSDVDFRLLTISELYPLVMAEDPASIHAASTGWMRPGGAVVAQAEGLPLAARHGEDLTSEPTWADGPQPVSTYVATGAPNPFTAARDAVTQHQRDLAEINGDDPDDLQDSDPVQAESYSAQQEYDEAVEEAEYLEQYTGSDYEVTVEHGVITVDPVDPSAAGRTPSAGLG